MNTNQLTKDAKFMLVLCNRISSKCNKKLNNTDIKNIHKIIEENPVETKTEGFMTYTNLALAFLKNDHKNIYDFLQNEINRRDNQRNIPNFERVDSSIRQTIIKKSLKSEIGSIIQKNQSRDLQMLINPRSRYKSKIIFLDSFFQNLTLNGTGIMRWDLNPSKNVPDELGIVNINSNIQNIVGMRLGGSKWSAVSLIGAATYIDDNRLNRYSMFIEELSAQSFIGTDGYRFHFMMQASGAGVDDEANIYEQYEMQLVPFNKGYYWFREPVTLLNSITFRFGDPFNQIRIVSNVFRGILIEGTNPMTVYVPSIGGRTFWFESFRPFTPTGFTTGDPVADAALIEQINGVPAAASPLPPDVPVPPPDYLIPEPGGIPTFSGRTLVTFPYDLSGTTLTNGPITITIQTNGYRYVWPLELIYLDDDE